MFRRPRRFLRRLVATPKPIEAQLNQLMQKNPAEAGVLLAEQARRLQNSQPRQAANLYARAAHTYIDSGDAQATVYQARAALTLFLQLDMGQRAQVFLANITRRLNERGMVAAATVLQQEYGARISNSPLAEAQPQRGELPTHCPHCGAALYREEVNWLDGQTAECDYCGSPVRTENNRKPD